MMSGKLPDRNHPSFSGAAPYQNLREETEDGDKRAREKEQCDKVFAEFGELRGRIIAGSIAVETVLDKVLASYYSPKISADPQSGEVSIEMFGPRIYRSTEFYDVILGNIGFDRKIQILFKTLFVAGIDKPTDLSKAFETVKRTRNKFAHSLVGIDAETGRCSLWSSRKREWDPVAADVEKEHRTQCDDALALLYDVSSEIERLLASGNQYPDIKFSSRGLEDE